MHNIVCIKNYMYTVLLKRSFVLVKHVNKK